MTEKDSLKLSEITNEFNVKIYNGQVPVCLACLQNLNEKTLTFVNICILVHCIYSEQFYGFINVLSYNAVKISMSSNRAYAYSQQK